MGFISRRSVICLALTGLALGSSAVSYAADGTIKIAVAGPMTGGNAIFGEQLRQGAVMAVKDINAAGGVNGKKLELVVGDDACEPKQAVAVASRLVEQDKVAAVIGHFCSSSTIPASDTYADANVLMMTPASTNPQVTERNLPTVLRTCGRDDQQGDVAGKFIIDTAKAKRVAIIHDKDTYGKGLADATKKYLNSHGVKEVVYEGLTRGEKDFNALVTKMKGANVDFVYFGGLAQEGGTLLRQMREQGLQAKFMSGDGITDKAFASVAGGGANVAGAYMTFGADPRKIPEGKAVVDAFRKSGYEPEGYTMYSYSTVQDVVAALKATNSTKGDVLAKWLKSNTVQTVMGPKAWDKKGDLTVSDYVVYQWKPDASYAQLN